MLPSIETSHFELKLSVRDYELDSFGVINNAVYQNYLEHTRHQFLESQGLKLTAYFEQGLSPVITKAEIEYRSSLQSRDDFVVSFRIGFVKQSKVHFSSGNPEHTQQNVDSQCKDYRNHPQFFRSSFFTCCVSKLAYSSYFQNKKLMQRV